MLEKCPDVDFYISPTLSLMNVLHVPDFHRAWVERGLLKPQDLNVNILQSPEWYRADCLPEDIKQQATAKLEEHIAWLAPQDVQPITDVKDAIGYFTKRLGKTGSYHNIYSSK